MERPEEIENQAEVPSDEDGQEGPQDGPAPAETAESIYVEAIGDLAKQRDEYYDLLLRKQAEFDNFRKRTEKNRFEARLQGQADLVLELLPVLDACAKGLEVMSAADPGPALTPYLEGYRLLAEQMKAVLEKFQVTTAPGVGSQFDPRVHEAVLREFTREHEEGTVIEEYRPGYLIRDKLLRAAQVKVAMPPPEEPPGQ
jgi:molecular chaperone GrpE